MIKKILITFLSLFLFCTNSFAHTSQEELNNVMPEKVSNAQKKSKNVKIEKQKSAKKKTSKKPVTTHKNKPTKKTRPLSPKTLETLSLIEDAVKPIEEEESEPIVINTSKAAPVKLSGENAPQKDESGNISVKKGGMEFSFSSEEKSELDRNMSDPYILTELGYKAYEAGQVEAAISMFKQALKIDNSQEDALFGLAMAYQRLGQLAEAKVLYNEVITTNPKNKEALNNFLAIVGEENPEEALKELQKLEKINNGLGIIPMQMAMIYAKQNDFKKSIKYMNRAMLIEPDNIIFKYNAAIVLDRMKDYPQSTAMYKEVMKMISDGAEPPENINIIRDRMDHISTLTNSSAS